MNAILFRTSAFLRLSLLGPVLVAILFVAQLASVVGETEADESGGPKDRVPALSVLPPDHGWGVPAAGASFEVDLTGRYFGTSWGQVTLKKVGTQTYEGTYSDTYRTGVGHIKLQWSSESMRYEGTWGEGVHRGGEISIRVRADGKAIRGAWTTNKDCEIKPGIPSLVDLEWTPVKGKDKALKLKGKTSDF
jgi:hypothetical protein